MIRIYTKNRGKSTKTFLEKLQNRVYLSHLEKYAKKGVEALSSATPVKTGLTAASWYYTITSNSSSIIITWNNSNVVKGYPIAVILDYGHGTGTGGYVQGRNYISPAIRPIFDKIAEDAWIEVTKL